MPNTSETTFPIELKYSNKILQFIILSVKAIHLTQCTPVPDHKPLDLYSRCSESMYRYPKIVVLSIQQQMNVSKK